MNRLIRYGVGAAIVAALGLAACGPKSKPVTQGAAVATPQDLAAHSAEFRREVVPAAEGVWVAVGYGIANSILVEGTDGSIVVDTMESLESAQAVAAAFRKVSQKPVKAVIYTHSHPDHIGGAPAFLTPGVAAQVIAQEDVARNMDKISSELQPIITRRSLQMYGWGLTPEERVNVGIGPDLDLHEGSVLDIRRPTLTFRDRLDTTIAGVHLVLVHAPGETDDQIFVWMPERRVLLSGDNLYRAFPNLYTIRGTGFRDPKKWAASLDVMRALKAEVMVPSHTRPLIGAALVADTLRDYRDAIRYVHDQGIRLMNQGYSPGEIAARLRLPPHLAASPFLQQFYGEPGWSARSLYDGNLGWFDGAPENLRPLPPMDEARHWLALAGGVSGMEKAIRDAAQRGEHQWVLRLTGLLLQVQPDDSVARAARMTALQAMGGADSNPSARHWYLSAYHQMKGDLKLPSRIVTPRPEMLAAMPLSIFFDGMAVNLDADAAAEVRTTVRFVFPDAKESWTLTVRRGVAEIVAPPADGQPLPPADLVVEVPAQVFKEMLARVRNPAVTLAREFHMQQGNLLELLRFMRLFVPEEAAQQP